MACLPLLVNAKSTDRWQIQRDGAITWKINDRLPHSDHIEMSGQMISVVLRYGVTADGQLTLNRSLVFPMLRMIPNKTSNHLQQRVDLNIATAVTLDHQTLTNEKEGTWLGWERKRGKIMEFQRATYHLAI